MNENEEFEVLVSIKKCPICGGEFEKGYVSSKILAWDTVKQGLTAHSKNSEMLTPLYAWSVTNFPTLRCSARL